MTMKASEVSQDNAAILRRTTDGAEVRVTDAGEYQTLTMTSGYKDVTHEDAAPAEAPAAQEAPPAEAPAAPAAPAAQEAPAAPSGNRARGTTSVASLTSPGGSSGTAGSDAGAS